MMDSGTFKNHLSGEAAFRSFIPLSLWEVVKQKETEQILWHQSEEIIRAVAETGGLLRQFQDMWSTVVPERQEMLKKRFLRQEAVASVCMAYPLETPPLFGFSLAETVLRDGFSFGAADDAGQAVGSSFDFTQTNQQGDGVSLPFIPVMQAQLAGFTGAAPAGSSKSPMERVPEELRKMAEEDAENLYQASKRSLKMMNSLPLSGRLLKELHYMALYAAHYDKQYRGEFRRSPVWIGQGGQDLRSAEFVPPVDEDMLQSFSDLERFLHYEETVPPLVKAALIHYQFETIHPFIDGNGRIGRLLTLLYLKETFDLECPWIPLSGSLLQGIDRYYKEIRTVQLYGDYARWTQWFLGVMDDAVKKGFAVLSGEC